MAADVAAAARFQNIHGDPLAVDVVHENLPAVFLRPLAAEVNHRAGVSVATAGCVALAVAAVRVGAEVVYVIGDRLDVIVRVRIEMLPGLTLISSALNDVIQVWND